MKMSIFALFIIGIAFQTKAETYKHGALLESHKSGVLAAMGGNTLCYFSSRDGGYNVDVLIQKADEVVVTDGAQPLMTFQTVINNMVNADLTKTEVTTSSDFKKIVKIDVISFKKGKINLGDLKNPSIVDGYIRDNRTCSIIFPGGIN